MTAGAFRGRRDRLIARAVRAATAAGLDARRANNRAVVRDRDETVLVGMGRSSMSNGETVLEPFVIVERKGKPAVSFGAFTWMPYDAPAAPFWKALRGGKWDTSTL